MADGYRVEILEDSIRLGKFLKLANAVDQGSDVKSLLTTGSVCVNGVVEERRGHRLTVGHGEVGRSTYVVTART